MRTPGTHVEMRIGDVAAKPSLLGCSRAASLMAYRVVLVLFSAGSPVYLRPLV